MLYIPSWDCNNQGNCVDPGNGLGAFTTLLDCQNNCAAPPMYQEWEDCKDGSRYNILPNTGYSHPINIALYGSIYWYEESVSNIGSIDPGAVVATTTPAGVSNCYKYIGENYATASDGSILQPFAGVNSSLPGTNAPFETCAECISAITP